MIYSDKQYRVSNAELTRLNRALRETEGREVAQEWLKQAEVDALRSQIADIEAEVAEYDLLRAGQISFAKTYSLEDLPRVLVQARIAFGLSQTDLAQKIGVQPQQIQRYEATSYMGASLARLVEIAQALNVKASSAFESGAQLGSSVFVWSDANDVVWGQFPYKEMIKRKWIKMSRHSSPLQQVKQYFLEAAGPQFVTALHRKKMHGGNVPNEYALIAWQARVLERSRTLVEQPGFAKFELNDQWLPELVSLTKREDGPKIARQLLASKGIALVVERHLPGSYLDGAAMLTASGVPVIGLTLRYDRLDNFWFVLFHELGHVFLHLFEGLRYDFFDEERASEGDPIESEADRFASDALTPENLWDQCLSRFALSEEAVRIDAATLGMAPSIIAGRIRKERNNYMILSKLIGQDRVRLQFDGADDDAE